MAKYTVTLAAGELWENGVTKFIQCPSNGEGIDGIIVKNSAGSVLGTFSLVDSNGAATSSIPNMWAAGFYIQVRFDTVNSKAQLLNGAISQAVLDKINAITPAQIGAVASSDLAKYLPRDGSAAMTGPLFINVGSRAGTVGIDSNNDYMYLQYRDDDGVSAANLTLNQNKVRFARTLDGATRAEYDILHTGNKPSGSYTGNGSAAYQEIPIGNSIGTGVLVITADANRIAFVMINGAVGFYFDPSAPGQHCFTANVVKYDGGIGKLILNTADALFNGNGTTYSWFIP